MPQSICVAAGVLVVSVLLSACQAADEGDLAVQTLPSASIIAPTVTSQALEPELTELLSEGERE